MVQEIRLVVTRKGEFESGDDSVLVGHSPNLPTIRSLTRG